MQKGLSRASDKLFLLKGGILVLKEGIVQALTLKILDTLRLQSESFCRAVWKSIRS